MDYLGNKLKERRLSKGLTQKQLADGICTQATISNLENNSSIPTFPVLMSLATKLDIEFKEIYDYVEEQSHKNTKIFNELRILCSEIKYKEAFELLNNKIDYNQLEDSLELRKYYYYKGITSLLAYQNFSDAHYNFHLSLYSDEKRELDFFDVLSTNGIAMTYFLDSETDKARTYFDKALLQLNQLMDYLNLNQESLEIIKIYYNTAKFHSSVKEYQKAIELCNFGIALQKQQNMNFELDKLYYEKGFNLYKLGRKKEAEEYYYYAAALAKMDNHDLILDIIKIDMQEFNLTGYTYWE
ncbi:Cro/Cl family transcriptional regulator [Carnobacterium maltaromaticum]|nr:Cro/Cl family transcriptional regulator [Carnobacterium maltaromaticum]